MPRGVWIYIVLKSMKITHRRKVIKFSEFSEFPNKDFALFGKW